MSSEPLLGPATVSWRVNHEPATFAGGGRALLLQVAHPLVAAGVEQHSTYATDPWGRLFRTLDTMLRISFGSPESAAAAAERLRHRHAHVRGASDEGVSYHASDPELLLWVWATLVETGLLMYERGVRPLSLGERERYYEEQKLIAAATGIPDGRCPETLREFFGYYEGMVAGGLRVTEAARAVAATIIDPVAPWPVRSVLAPPNNLLTEGLLPPRLRDDYGFDWNAGRERRLSAVLAAMRLSARLTPSALRFSPVGRVADGRAGWLERRLGTPPPRPRAA